MGCPGVAGCGTGTPDGVKARGAGWVAPGTGIRPWFGSWPPPPGLGRACWPGIGCWAPGCGGAGLGFDGSRRRTSTMPSGRAITTASA